MSDKPVTWIKWDQFGWRGPRDNANLYVDYDGYLTMIAGDDLANGMRIQKRFEMADLKMMIREVLDEYDLPRRQPITDAATEGQE